MLNNVPVVITGIHMGNVGQYQLRYEHVQNVPEKVLSCSLQHTLETAALLTRLAVSSILAYPPKNRTW